MGLLTWIIVAVVVLAIIGLGVGTFFSGVFKGFQIVGNNPVVKNATGEAKQYVSNVTSQKLNDVKNSLTNGSNHGP